MATQWIDAWGWQFLNQKHVLMEEDWLELSCLQKFLSHRFHEVDLWPSFLITTCICGWRYSIKHHIPSHWLILNLHHKNHIFLDFQHIQHFSTDLPLDLKGSIVLCFAFTVTAVLHMLHILTALTQDCWDCVPCYKIMFNNQFKLRHKICLWWLDELKTL